MNELFTDEERLQNAPGTVADAAGPGLIHPTPNLPSTAAEYGHGRRTRVGADPIGLSGLPATREGLNARLLELCNRLAAIGGLRVNAQRLVEEMELSGDRTLRLLMAYGHVHHRIRELVGIEGVGYCWGADNPDAIAQAARIAKRKGLCYMFLSSLYGKQSLAVQLVQMALNFRKADGQADGQADELDVWVAAENVTPATLVESFVSALSETPEGVDALQQAAHKRPGIFLSKEISDKLQEHARGLLDILGDGSEKKPHESKLPSE